MKLYTEEQVRKAMEDVYLGCYSFEDVKYIFNRLKPIELPSDKEIEKQALLAEDNDLSPVEEWERGAKWLKEYITKTK